MPFTIVRNDITQMQLNAMIEKQSQLQGKPSFLPSCLTTTPRSSMTV